MFEDIKIRLDWRDTRAMRPDTMDEKVDDAVMRFSNQVWDSLLHGDQMLGKLEALEAWLP